MIGSNLPNRPITAGKDRLAVVEATSAANRHDEGGHTISSKLYVGNLSYDTTQTDLETLFSEVGEVTDVYLPSDRVTGRPRGFAFVSFRDDAMASAAITRFDGHELGGRALKINEAQERSSAPRFRQEAGSGWNNDAPKRSRPKGSRKNARARKRSL